MKKSHLFVSMLDQSLAQSRPQLEPFGLAGLVTLQDNAEALPISNFLLALFMISLKSSSSSRIKWMPRCSLARTAEHIHFWCELRSTLLIQHWINNFSNDHLSKSTALAPFRKLCGSFALPNFEQWSWCPHRLCWGILPSTYRNSWKHPKQLDRLGTCEAKTRQIFDWYSEELLPSIPSWLRSLRWDFVDSFLAKQLEWIVRVQGN